MNQASNDQSAHIKGEDKSPIEKYYWAACPLEDLGGHLREKCENYYKFLNTWGFRKIWNRAYRYYFGGKITNGGITYGGDTGEYTQVHVNLSRTYIQHIMNLTINSRPDFDAQAANTDASTQEQCIVADDLINTELTANKVELDIFQAVEFSLCFGEGFVHSEWDFTAGKITGTLSNGEVTHEGKYMASAVEPIDVIRDPKLESFRYRDWLIIRKLQNKYTLMAKYPEYAEELEAATATFDLENHYRPMKPDAYTSDQIITYIFYHAKTAAMPNGRYALMLHDETILTAGPLPYRHIPVRRMAPGEKFGTPLGYSPLYDIMPLQDRLNMLVGTVYTNQETYGVQNIITTKASGMTSTLLAGGLNLLKVNSMADAPKPLNLTETPTEIFNSIKMTTGFCDTVSGINQVTQGNIPSSGMSGAAMALLQSMAIQYNEPIQFQYVQMLEGWAQDCLSIYQDYASTERITTLIGKSNKSYTKSFSAKNIVDVQTVNMVLGNPAMNTPAGNLQKADMLIQAKVLTMPDEILQVINTGNYEAISEGKQEELIAIKQENEMLNQGKAVPVLVTDDHVLHIHQHKYDLSDPNVRMGANTRQANLNHIYDHIKALSDPENAQLLQLLGQPVIQAQQPQPGAASPGGQAPSAAPQSGGPPSNPMGAIIPGGQNVNSQVMAHQPNPNQLKNPLSKKPFNTVNGGLK